MSHQQADAYLRPARKLWECVNKEGWYNRGRVEIEALEDNLPARLSGDAEEYRRHIEFAIEKLKIFFGVETKLNKERVEQIEGRDICAFSVGRASEFRFRVRRSGSAPTCLQ